MQEGKVGPTLHKNPITSEQLQQLYGTGQPGEGDTLDPSQILRTKWFYITFCLKGNENHRKLTSDMLVLRSTPQGRRYYEFRIPFLSTNHQADNPDESASAFGSVDNTYLDLDYSGYHKNLSNNCLKYVFLTCFLSDQLGETKTIRPFALKLFLLRFFRFIAMLPFFMKCLTLLCNPESRQYNIQTIQIKSNNNNNNPGQISLSKPNPRAFLKRSRPGLVACVGAGNRLLKEIHSKMREL